MNLQYLDLEIPRQKQLVTCNNSRHKCCFRNYSHEIHGENSQMNSMVDIVISLGESIEHSHKEVIKYITQVIQRMEKDSKTLKDIQDNHQYIKVQLEMLQKKVRGNNPPDSSMTNNTLKQIEAQLTELKRLVLS